MTQAKTDSQTGPSPSEYMVEAYAKLGDAMAQFVRNPPIRKPNRRFDALAAFSALNDVMKGIWMQPERLLEAQTEAVNEWSQMWTRMWGLDAAAEPLVVPERGDRRFRDEQWESSACFSKLKDSYLLIGKHLRALVQASAEEDPGKRALAELLVEQYLNAVAPTNFVFTNPEVLRRTVETGGANLVSGFANMISDLSTGRGIVQRRTDHDAFKLGENIACTPGAVVYQNDLMQLIQYTPTTKKVRSRPVLYVPPLVNKYYMVDLQPRSSLIKWLVDEGNTVFVVSWVDPDESHRHCAVDDYVGHGVIEAIDQIIEATGQKSVDTFGFCMGGTLVTMAAAVLAARGEGAKIGTATLIGALVDFADMMEWSAFVNEAHVEALDVHIGEKGYIDKDELQQLFSLMRANDLVWSSFISHYLLDKESPPSDLLFWFEDGSHIPQAFLRSYNRKLLVEDKLRVPCAVELLGEHLDLTKIDSPVMIIGLKDDHVSSWSSVFRGKQYFGGPVEFVLGGSGHNAGVINPPSANKHGYWTNTSGTNDSKSWLAGADKHEGSWWPYWMEWLDRNDNGGQVAARKLGIGRLEVLEEAPGSYVLGR